MLGDLVDRVNFLLDRDQEVHQAMDSLVLQKNTVEPIQVLPEEIEQKYYFPIRVIGHYVFSLANDELKDRKVIIYRTNHPEIKQQKFTLTPEKPNLELYLTAGEVLYMAGDLSKDLTIQLTKNLSYLMVELLEKLKMDVKQLVTETDVENWNDIPNIKKPVSIPNNRDTSDLNDYITPGFYSFYGSGAENSPTNVEAWSQLIVTANNNIVSQIALIKDEVYIRRNGTSNNKLDPISWTKLTNEKDLKKQQEETTKAINDHINEPMPHIGTRTDGSKYRWGFRSENGSLIYMEEEVR